eukprot:Rmarinus@m.15778
MLVRCASRLRPLSYIASRSVVSAQHLKGPVYQSYQPAQTLPFSSAKFSQSTMMTPAGLTRIKPSETVFFLCDIQERFRELIFNFGTLLHFSKELVDGARALNIPIIATEQYPKALGHLVSELEADGIPVADKTLFSMCIDSVQERISQPEVKNVVLFGLETHVCILQTAIDLTAAGKNVFLVLDAVSSQRQLDRQVAITRMVQAGVVPCTTESILFQLVGDAKHPDFKKISEIAKRPKPSVAFTFP